MIQINSQILVVDDTPTNIQLVSSILGPLHYELSFSLNGKDAIEQVMNNNFDLILLDLMMPEMDGYEVCQTLKAMPKYRDIPIIFLTAKTHAESIARGFEVGGADYLTKPFHAQELVARVKTQLALKHNQDKLRFQNESLSEALALKNKLLGMAAHDLKNPLGVIQGYAELLLDCTSVQGDPDAFEMTDAIFRSSQRSLRLISDLLESTAFAMGKIELNLLMFPMSDLIAHVLHDLRPLAQQKNQTLQFDSLLPGIMQGDLNRLKQVVENLVSNAIKYSPHGSLIQIRLEQTDAFVQVVVTDQGPGFTPEDQSKLYQYFQRLSAQPTGDESSNGMGLAIVKQIVELHKGTITLETAPKEGSTFTVSLPKEHN